MSLITLFSAPKPLTDPHIAMIQRNAVQSWMRLPEVEVILLGNEDGLDLMATEYKTKYIHEVGSNTHGTPLISSMIELACQNSTSPMLGIVNTDIILLPDLVEAVRCVVSKYDRFTLLSRRWDLEMTQPLDFSSNWEEKLRNLSSKEAKLHRPVGSDFFIFPRSCYGDVPPFAIGRSGWDNWMIYKARLEKWPVIDCTPSILVVHQNHDYSHLPGGKSHHTTAETNENIGLAGGQASIRYTILDATHELIIDKLARPRITRQRLARQIELVLRSLFFFLPDERKETVVRPKRWIKRIQKLFKSRGS